MAGLAESYGGIIFPDPRNQCLIAKPISLGIYKGQGTTIEFLPIFFRQVTLIVAVVRLLLFFCSILRQPPFIAEALSGLAAYYVGRIDTVNVFPVQSLTYLEIIARWGLLFYGFLAGQETDLEALRRPTLESLAIVLIGIPVCYAIAAVTIVLSMGVFDLRIIFVGASALSMTSAASVTHLLAGLKLLNAPISQTAVASAIIGDAYSWAALILFIALCNNSALQVLIAAAFVSLCCAAARFAKLRSRRWWFLARGDDRDVSNKQVCWAIVAVMAAALSADAVGMKSVVGAYVFGLFIPKGRRMEILTEKMEYMVMKTIVPLFYCVSGMRAAMALDSDYDAVWRWSPVLAAAATVCRIAAVFAASFWVYQPRHAVALGLLMNAKGFVSLLLLNLAWENAIIGDREFAVSFFAFVLMTAAVAPLLQVFYRPAVKDSALYDHRTIGSLGQNAGDLRVLACVHSTESVSGVISLLRASNATPSSPLYVFILHLVELAHRSSSVLIVHDTRRIGSHGGATPEQFVGAFDSFEQSSSDVAVEPLTATSPLSTMHEDICGLAEDNRVALLILPFQPHSRSAAALASPARHQNSAYAAVSRRVLDHAPCSVGIFVDRGASAEWSRITVLFFFGADDREALAYGWRMARRVGAWLTVVRFVLEEGANELQLLGEVEGDEFEAIEEYARQKRLDNEFVAEFRKRTQGSSGVSYREAVLRGGEETATAMRELDRSEKRDLYLVGRGARAVSPLTAGHGKWSDDPELGPIGDILVSPGFSPEASVLVVQRYFGGLPSGGDAATARGGAATARGGAATARGDAGDV